MRKFLVDGIPLFRPAAIFFSSSVQKLSQEAAILGQQGKTSGELIITLLGWMPALLVTGMMIRQGVIDMAAVIGQGQWEYVERQDQGKGQVQTSQEQHHGTSNYRYR